MKIISWNVNGIRAAMKKGFGDFLKKERPDILCLQEIKINDAARAKEQFDFKDYDEYWHPAKRPGYSGTAMLVSKKSEVRSKSYKSGMGVEEFDREGRAQTMEFEKFYLLNAYFPNINREHSRMGYKLKFNSALLNYVKKLGKRKPVVIGGDFNVAHEEIDLARPKDNVDNAGFTEEERTWMTEFLNAGFLDTYRLINKNKIQYSWWTYRFGARARNVGWRIDYFCVSRTLKKAVKNAFILDKVMGSDHAPVGVELAG